MTGAPDDIDPELISALAESLSDALLAEERDYWPHRGADWRPREMPPITLAWTDADTIALQWSQEWALGPRDYDEDARARMDDIARRCGAATVTIGGNLASLEAWFNRR